MTVYNFSASVYFLRPRWVLVLLATCNLIIIMWPRLITAVLITERTEQVFESTHSLHVRTRDNINLNSIIYQKIAATFRGFRQKQRQKRNRTLSKCGWAYFVNISCQFARFWFALFLIARGVCYSVKFLFVY